MHIYSIDIFQRKLPTNKNYDSMNLQHHVKYVKSIYFGQSTYERCTSIIRILDEIILIHLNLYDAKEINKSTSLESISADL